MYLLLIFGTLQVFQFINGLIIVFISSFVLSCLADLIFVIYLYQRWIYKVDKKRVNEFGFGGEDDQAVAETDATKEEENTTTEEEKKTN